MKLRNEINTGIRRWLVSQNAPTSSTPLSNFTQLQNNTKWYGVFVSGAVGKTAWRRHQMETFSALLALREGNPSVIGGFPLLRPVTRSFDVFFDLRLNKRLSKQSRRRWFETPSRSLWRHCNMLSIIVPVDQSQQQIRSLFPLKLYSLCCVSCRRNNIWGNL